MTFLILTLLACGEKETSTDSAVDYIQDSGDSEPPPEFQPSEGQWTYSGGELIAAGTTCPEDLDAQDDGSSDVTDPVGFTLANTSTTSFSLTSDDSTDAVNCTVTETSETTGTFVCADSSVEKNITDSGTEGVIPWTYDVDLTIDTSSAGGFASATSMVNTFTLTLTCLEASTTAFGEPAGSSCSDITDQFPSPCTIQFSANATLDQ
jgi:hypothetical protein